MGVVFIFLLVIGAIVGLFLGMIFSAKNKGGNTFKKSTFFLWFFIGVLSVFGVAFAFILFLKMSGCC